MIAAKLNLDLLTKLLKDNKNALKHALELFIETTEEDLFKIGQCIQTEKYADGARIAHSLKTRFVYLGNQEAGHSVNMLECLLKEGKENTVDKIQSLFLALKTETEKCFVEVEEQIKKLEK